MPRALVTGANRGIGLELARQLRERGWEVIATARHSSAELDALGLRVEPLDVADDEAVRALGERLRGVELDLLINNAGILERGGLDSLDLAGIRRQFEVNALGPLKVTAALRGNLRRGGKVAVITSRMGSIGDNSSGGYYGYRMSKAAVNMAAMSLSRDLAGDGISVMVIHPGMVSTAMIGYQGNVEPADAVRGILARIDELGPETTGSFRHANGETLPW